VLGVGVNSNPLSKAGVVAASNDCGLIMIGCIRMAVSDHGIMGDMNEL